MVTHVDWICSVKMLVLATFKHFPERGGMYIID